MLSKIFLLPDTITKTWDQIVYLVAFPLYQKLVSHVFKMIESSFASNILQINDYNNESFYIITF